MSFNLDGIAKSQSMFPGPEDRWVCVFPEYEDLVPSDFIPDAEIQINYMFKGLADNKPKSLLKYRVPSNYQIVWAPGNQQIFFNGQEFADFFFDRDYDEIEAKIIRWL